MTQPLLELDGVLAGYGEPVVGPFSLVLQAGDVIGLAGPNGSGKSTLLKAIANGARVFGGSVRRRPGLSIAWQQQQQPVLDGLPFSGRDFLNFAGVDTGRVPPRLADWLDTRVDSLSGGQFQLLGVWAALGGSADLVLLDEPTNNLDPEGERVIDETVATGLGRRALLVVSHERRFLDRICSRVLEVGV